MSEKIVKDYQIISVNQLVKAVREGRSNSERFCFIIGSGASVSSGIPTGAGLEAQWMKEMEESPGLDENGEVVLGDEMLTPDSSRFWPNDGYEPGKGQPSFDKQYVRDWLKANPDHGWTLPQDIVDKTIHIYLEGYEKLTGKAL